MRFPPSFLDEIKARLPVSEVVRHRVKLLRAGREWKGLSPFNSEKTPSFFVNDQKMAWFDHSAGKNGNIFDFLMETEGLSFPEAVKQLAHEAGLALPRVSPEAEAEEKARTSLHEVLALAAAYFCTQLAGGHGSAARAYLAGRGLDSETQGRFQLGYALPEKYALRDALAARGIPVPAMIEAGLLIHGEEIAVPYDRFRDRIMFPIHDAGGKVIAFGGRALAKDAQAKYLNSPETALFHKGAILFNHHRARKAAHDGTPLIVVEGYIDVIAMASVGFEATVAPLGTALSAEQCELLWKMAEEPVLCFDGDRAGRKAAYRAIDMALPLIGPGRSLSFALLPEGEDPDDLARAGGREAVSQLLAQAQPLADLIWIRETENKIFATPERRAGLERRFGEIVRDIRDETLHRYYQAEFKARLPRLFGRPFFTRDPSRPFRGAARTPGSRPSWQRVGGLQTDLTLPPQVSRNLMTSPLFRPGQSRLPAREGLILLLLLSHPGLIGSYVEDLAEIGFSSSEAGALRDALIAYSSSAAAGEGQPGDAAASLRSAVEHQGFAPVLRKLDAMAAHASHWYLKPEAAEADAGEVLKQALSLHRRARALHKELQLAELALGKDSSEANLGRLKDIQAQLSALGGIEAAIDGFGVQSGRPGGSL
ncbi:DNA primase [Methylocapsa sp. D3K7]|uniref:DNA primase n=1 Tax=Methylocapsa sp. D3K7 TaxID=3041435 RepID=UPI00244EB46E|nr:DNA primase [Methylocapsa sp. D3K7]WGJ15247.1 DNA primase [Methylocapsa sp. D3K7]